LTVTTYSIRSQLLPISEGIHNLGMHQAVVTMGFLNMNIPPE